MLRVVFALLFGTLTASLAQAQPMPEAAAQLTGRIYSLLQRRTTVSLELLNLTAIGPAELSSFRTALEQELRKTGLEMTAAAQSETRLRVTISENVRGLLLVAELTSGDNRQIAMLPWSAPPPAEMKPRVKISMQLVHEQADAILDTLLVDSGSQLLVLGASKVSSYRLTNGTWTPAAIAGVALARPLPRDPRGRMESGDGGIRVFAPGSTCTGTLQPDFKLTCTPGNETFPVNPRDPALGARWVTDRNLLESESVKGSFYTVGAGLLASSDGRILDLAGEPLPGTDGWGSDLASIQNPCATGWMVLATKAVDADHDQIQVFEIADGRAAAASEPIHLAGPAQALWPAETPGQATLVVRNLKTGNYEASRLGVACTE